MNGTNPLGSPHGYAGARDLSGHPNGASGDPTYSVRVIAPCVCGGEIEAASDPWAIREAVDTHNVSTIHQQWRSWHEL